ncbi:MAG TPA: SGNH/GDSL hydrolase family protein [Vicinamibacteria bacterium]|nr:SGNH/GDSL hydrolase family protein [Vicinamibacteria bacterium]
MIIRFRLLPLALVLLAGPAIAQQAPLSNYVALGDSLTAGVVNGSVVETHQRNSYPALIARQAGLNLFQQPTVAEPGNPPELQLISLLPATIISPKAASAGAPNNLTLPRPYNNLGIPTANTPDYLSKVTDGGGPFDLVLRGLGTGVAQAVASKAAVYTVWLGNNDVLGAVVRGVAQDGVTLTPASAFRSSFGQIVTALATTGGKIVVATIPDVTTIPYVTTIPPVVVNPSTRQPVLVGGSPVALIGPSGPLATGTYVTLAASSLLAQGVGVPTSLGGTGAPLPGEVILDQAEVAIIQDRVRDNNQAIRDVAQANGATVIDLNAVLADIHENGRNVGGVAITTDFLTGGLFGYDGLHLTDLGYALLANEWIAAFSTAGVATLPAVNLAPFLGLTSVSASGMSVSAKSVRQPAFEFTPEAQDHLLALFPLVDGR